MACTAVVVLLAEHCGGDGMDSIPNQTSALKPALLLTPHMISPARAFMPASIVVVSEVDLSYLAQAVLPSPPFFLLTLLLLLLLHLLLLLLPTEMASLPHLNEESPPRTRSEARPYRCLHCNAAFKRPAHLRRHEASRTSMSNPVCGSSGHSAPAVIPIKPLAPLLTYG